MAEDMGEKSEQPTGSCLADAERPDRQVQLLAATIDLIGRLILAVLGDGSPPA